MDEFFAGSMVLLTIVPPTLFVIILLILLLFLINIEGVYTTSNTPSEFFLKVTFPREPPGTGFLDICVRSVSDFT